MRKGSRIYRLFEARFLPQLTMLGLPRTLKARERRASDLKRTQEPGDLASPHLLGLPLPQPPPNANGLRAKLGYAIPGER